MLRLWNSDLKLQRAPGDQESFAEALGKCRLEVRSCGRLRTLKVEPNP